jgi:predicted MFS family arabinose efflux permease
MLAAITTAVWGPAASIAGNAISFVAMALVIQTIRRKLHGGGTVRFSQAHSEITNAAKLAWRTAGTRTMIISTVFVQLCCAMTFSTIPNYAASVSHWKRFWMVLYTSMGIGALAAGFCVAFVTARIGRSRTLTVVPAISCLAIFLASQAHSAYLAVIATMLFGMSAPISFITMGAVVQRDAPEAYRGRVLSIYSALVGTAFGGFSIMNGYLSDNFFGLRTTLWISSIVLALYVVSVRYLWPSWAPVVNGRDPDPMWRADSLPRNATSAGTGY